MGGGNIFNAVPRSSLASDKEGRGVGKHREPRGEFWWDFYFMLIQSLDIMIFFCFPFQDQESYKNKYSIRKNNQTSFIHNKLAREFSLNPQRKKKDKLHNIFYRLTRFCDRICGKQLGTWIQIYAYSEF